MMMPMSGWKGAALAALFTSHLLSLSAPVNSQFVHPSGTKILDENGDELFFNGINLGNWLVWEGYLMMGDFNYRTHTQFFNSLSVALGGVDKAAEFEYQWRLNYVDEKAIADLSDLGFNSVRVPFNFKLFYQNGAIVNDGFEFFDCVISYCRTYGLYVLLDMHGAPGYQNPGDHADNGDSNANQPRGTVKFWDGDNVALAASIWKHIAAYYKDEPVVWGYDLINEPVPQSGREFELLPSYVEMAKAIREVDTNHIIVAEGSWWGSDLTKIDWEDPQCQQATGITQKWDPKLVYQIHHYGQASGTFGREQITQKLGIPIFIGEYGETDEYNLKAITDWAKTTLEGYFPWSFKKMSHDRCLWTIPPNAAYDQVKAHINNPSGTPPTHLYDEMISFAQVNVKNGHASHEWHQGFYNAIKPDITCAEAASFAVPGTIQAEEYCGHFGVQLESTNDAGGGQNIGFLDPGDFTEYSIDVATAGEYTFTARVASMYETGQMDVQVDGTSLAILNIPQTFGWQTWTTISRVISLSMGTHSLKLVFPNGNFNVNWVSFEYFGAPPPTIPPVPTPPPSNKPTTPSELQLCLASNAELQAQIDSLKARLAVYEPEPTISPTPLPTKAPIPSPTLPPTPGPTPPPPTTGPTTPPTPAPTDAPTVPAPTKAPTPNPTKFPTNQPTPNPTPKPTTKSPTKLPTPLPTNPPNSTPQDCTTAPAFILPSQFQAEQYCNMQGVVAEPAGYVTQIGNGDFLEYNINVPTGQQYTFAARVKSPVYSGQINLQLNGTSALWLSVPHTNGQWKTVWANVYMNPGVHKLKVAFPQGGFDVDWMAFNAGTNNPPV